MFKPDTEQVPKDRNPALKTHCKETNFLLPKGRTHTNPPITIKLEETHNPEKKKKNQRKKTDLRRFGKKKETPSTLNMLRFFHKTQRKRKPDCGEKRRKEKTNHEKRR